MQASPNAKTASFMAWPGWDNTYNGGPQAPMDGRDGRIKVAEYTLELTVDDGKCVVTRTKGGPKQRLETDIDAPCYWRRHSEQLPKHRIGGIGDVFALPKQLRKVKGSRPGHGSFERTPGTPVVLQLFGGPTSAPSKPGAPPRACGGRLIDLTVGTKELSACQNKWRTADACQGTFETEKAWDVGCE